MSPSHVAKYLSAEGKVVCLNYTVAVQFITITFCFFQQCIKFLSLDFKSIIWERSE